MGNNGLSGTVSSLLAIPVLALFGGIGLLAYKVSELWTPENTQYLLGGVLAICGGGVVAFAAVAGLAVGLGVYRRGQERAQKAEERAIEGFGQWRPQQMEGYPGGGRAELEEPKGVYISGGARAYDLWQEEESLRLRKS